MSSLDAFTVAVRLHREGCKLWYYIDGDTKPFGVIDLRKECGLTDEQASELTTKCDELDRQKEKDMSETTHTHAHVPHPDALPVQSKAGQQVPSIGRIVHYVLSDGDKSLHPSEHRPAMIVKVWGDQPDSAVQLQVFTDSTNDFTHGHTGANGILWRTSVLHNEEKTPSSWHWPEYVPNV